MKNRTTKARWENLESMLNLLSVSLPNELAVEKAFLITLMNEAFGTDQFPKEAPK